MGQHCSSPWPRGQRIVHGQRALRGGAESVAGQRAEIGRRLAKPRYADPHKVRDFFSRFGLQNG